MIVKVRWILCNVGMNLSSCMVHNKDSDHKGGDMKHFNIGDVVEIKAGSAPLMTITFITEDGRYRCTWYAKDAEEFKEKVFDGKALRKIDA